MTAFSCDKENELQPREEEPIPTKAYSTSTPVSAYEFDSEAKDSPRAMIISKGYSVPKLNVTKEEFKANAIPAHIGVMGNNQENIFKSTLNILDSKPSKITEDAFLITQGASITDPTLINMYCQLPQTLTTDKSYAWLALDGKLVANKLVYNSANGTSPNAIVKGIKNTNVDDARHLPIITNIVPFNRLFAPLTKKSIRFNPRGVLVGISLINQLDESITLKSITFPEDNALFFEGSFDCQKDMEGKAYKSALVSNANEAKAMLFEGENKSVTIPVKQDTNATLVSQSGKTVNASLKESLPLFYVWGFPNNGIATLKVKLSFSKNGKDVESKVLNIAIPSAGFEEGKAYRLPIKLNEDGIQAPEMINPLAYVADFNINRDGIGFATHNNVVEDPKNSAEGDTGYFTLNEAKNLFKTNSYLNNYCLPEENDWYVAVFGGVLRFPANSEGERFSKLDVIVRSNEARINETYIAKSNNVQISKLVYPIGRYYPSKKSPFSIAYLIRFEGTIFHSAWKYEIIASKFNKYGIPTNAKFVVQSRSIKDGSSTTIETITEKDYFNHNDVVTKEFALNGIPEWTSSGKPHESYESYPTDYIGSNIEYMTGTIIKSFGEWGLRVYSFIAKEDHFNTKIHTNSTLKQGYTNEFLYKLPVRPFYKEYPLKKK